MGKQAQIINFRVVSGRPDLWRCLRLSELCSWLQVMPAMNSRWRQPATWLLSPWSGVDMGGGTRSAKEGSGGCREV